MLPVKVLMTDLVSVWKHSMWILCTGLVVFSISEQGLVISIKCGREKETASWIWIIITRLEAALSALKALWQQTGENGRDFTEIMFGILSLFQINQVPAILSCKHPGQTNTKYCRDVFSLPRKQSRIERTAKSPTKTRPVMRTGLVKSV